MASAIFQRKFLRKPSPSALVNYKNQVNLLKENFILSIPILDWANERKTGLFK